MEAWLGADNDEDEQYLMKHTVYIGIASDKTSLTSLMTTLQRGDSSVRPCDLTTIRTLKCQFDGFLRKAVQM